MSNRSLYYITYQTFPAYTANSLQTIKNIKYLLKNKVDVTLFFPLRESGSSESLHEINRFYGENLKFEVHGSKHKYPFGKIKYFNKIFFHVSHFLWSRKVVKNIFKNYKQADIYFTRSDWVYLFLILRKVKVVFECHQTSKLRNILIKIFINNRYSKIIFLNNELIKNFKNLKNQDKIKVLHNAVDLEDFNLIDTTKFNQIVFVGRLSRFNKSRGLEIIIKAFKNSQLSSNFKLVFVGGPDDVAQNLKSEYINEKNIEFKGQLSHKEAIQVLGSSKIGVLSNSSENLHSKFYTSPLKYYEYLAANLHIVAVDFPSHRDLPFSENIFFYEENSNNQLENIFNSLNLEPKEVKINLDEISLSKRANEIIKFSLN